MIITIKFQNVKKSYGNTLILNNLNFEIKEGEFTVLIGPSGCGKTTTLKTINRLIEPDGGKIFINNEDTTHVNRVELRRKIGYVIQQIGLFPNMTVAQNICVVPKLLKYDKKKCDELVHNLLEIVNMPYEQYAHKYPNELSGGQQQRIGVLRALAASPPIVLMDEPFGALDPMTRTVLQDEVKRLQKKLNKTIVFVTHDMDEALNLADKIIFMDKGEIIQNDTPESMLANPKNNLIRSFLGKRTDENESFPLYAADFMRTNIIWVNTKKGIRECTELMARKNVDTLLVVNDDNTFAGTVSVSDIRKSGNTGDTIASLVSKDNIISKTDEYAKECFDKLVTSGNDYVVVLHEDHTMPVLLQRQVWQKP